MNKDTSQMTAREFAEWNYTPRHSHQGQFEEAVAARDAYREKVALEAAAESVRVLVANEWSVQYPLVRDAILGKPAFVRGQLVRNTGDNHLYKWMSGPEAAHMYEPVHAHIDDAGRVIVDEEARK